MRLGLNGLKIKLVYATSYNNSYLLVKVTPKSVQSFCRIFGTNRDTGKIKKKKKKNCYVGFFYFYAFSKRLF